jgi:hypothetical protein
MVSEIIAQPRTKTLVANVPTRVFNRNPDRVSFNVYNNDSTNSVYWGTNQNVATSGEEQGIEIAAKVLQEELHHTGEVWVISANAVSITFYESVEIKG